MRSGSRRKLDVALLGVGGLGLALAAGIGSVVGNSERMSAMWVGATLGNNGDAQVTEVIDWNFGFSTDKHGIFRDVKDLSSEAQVEVQSATADADVQVSATPPESASYPATRLRIGSPNETVTGSHRYQIDYNLGTIVPGGSLAWDAVGAGWTVPIAKTDINVVAPWTFTDTRCVMGKQDSTTPCDIEQPEPGRLVVQTGQLDPGEGVTVFANKGAVLAAAPALAVPPLDGKTSDDPMSPALPFIVAGLAALVAALPASRLIRHAGRERVGVGGAADAAFGGGKAGVGERRIDEAELEEMTTIEFAPPDDISPAEGGIVLTQDVRPEHKVAWLITEAIDGSVAIDEENGKSVQLRRLGFGEPPSVPLLNAIFGGRQEVPLGRYDPSFAAGWSALGASLQDWADNSNYWDMKAGRRKVTARVVGVLALIPAVIVTFVCAMLAARGSPAWLIGVGIGGLVGGVALAAIVRAWELKVRTPQGTAMWLRVESFRRFLAESEGYHAEQAAARGVLREYTAWAVAVGEVNRWAHAMQAATNIPDRSALNYALAYAFIAPSLSSATSSTSTAPSSSGGGGGGGGGVGGGGGGGGGGSW